MSLVVRPKRANKKAIDYAQLANGSMSVEDADESPPPQSAGNGKRKLEPTGGSSKAPKGKAPAGKAPAAVPAPPEAEWRGAELERPQRAAASYLFRSFSKPSNPYYCSRHLREPV